MTDVRFSVHPAVQMAAKIFAGLPEKTGRSLQQWVELIHADGPGDDKERIAWLKSEHGLGTNYAGWLVEEAAGRGRERRDPEAYLAAAPGYLEAQYAGKKEHLWPICERLLGLGVALGDDVRVCPGKTIVPLYRKRVFAEIKAATLSRVDLGLALGDTEAEGRLLDTGGFAKKDRITHRIPIAQPAEIDAEVERRLREAYERDS